MFDKYDPSAATKTHGLVPATLLDVVNPTVPMSTGGEFTRMLLSGFVGYIGRGYKETRTFSL